MKLIYRTDKKNSYGISLLLEKGEGDFYGTRWENESLTWGYNVNACGTQSEVTERLKRLIELNEQNIKKYREEHMDVLLEYEEEEYEMNCELLNVITHLERYEINK